jgi:flagellar biosynthetic protein FlhB
MPQQSGEKTEKATPKRKRDAREKGQVFKSQELSTALSLIVIFGIFAIFGGSIVERIKFYLETTFSVGKNIPDVVTKETLSPYFLNALKHFLLIVMPIFIGAFISALVFNILQVGFLFAPKALKPKLDKISMVAGFKRLFSMRTVGELFKSIIKISIIGIVAYNEYKVQMDKMPMLMMDNVVSSTQKMVNIIIGVGF